VTARPRTEPEADAAALTLEPEHLSDLGNARRLVRTFGENLRYVPAWRAWRVWTGASWTEDETGQVERYAKDVAAEIYVEAGYEQDERRRRELARWAIASESHRGIRGMIALAQSERGIAVPPGAFDRDPWLLNVANGTVNLKTGTLREHRRADLITKLIPVAYDPAADAPIFLDFLRRIFAGNRDLIDYVRRAVGYSLTGDTSEQVLLLCWGTGANGKTTLMQTLAMLLAGYASRLDANTLLAGKGDRGLVMNDLFGLQGARFVFAVEADMGRKLAEALVKELTGGESIRVKKLYADIFTIEPQFKLWIGTNYKPEIRGTDRAIWRRIRLVPFDVTIPESEQDRGLTERLRAEAAGHPPLGHRGVPRLAVRGARRARGGADGDRGVPRRDGRPRRLPRRVLRRRAWGRGAHRDALRPLRALGRARGRGDPHEEELRPSARRARPHGETARRRLALARRPPPHAGGRRGERGGVGRAGDPPDSLGIDVRDQRAGRSAGRAASAGARSAAVIHEGWTHPGRVDPFSVNFSLTRVIGKVYGKRVRRVPTRPPDAEAGRRMRLGARA